MEKTYLTEEEVLKDNFFIQNVLIGNRVVSVFVGINTNDFKFFYNKNNGLELIGGELHNKLLKKLAPVDDGVFRSEGRHCQFEKIRKDGKRIVHLTKYGKVSFQIMFDEDINFDSRDEKFIVEKIKKTINRNIKRLEDLDVNPDIIKIAVNNLDQLVIAGTKKVDIDNCSGYYELSQHAIVIPVKVEENHYEYEESTMSHELFHAMSGFSNFAGLSFTYYCKRNTPQQFEKSKLSLKGFNELVTEGLAGKINGKYGGYKEAMYQFLTLFSNKVPKFVYEAYITNNQQKFINGFAQEFGLPKQSVVRYIKRLDIFVEENYYKKLSNYDLEDLKKVTFDDSVLFKICKIWSAQKDVTIEDFKQIAVDAGIGVSEAILSFYRGLAYCDPSFSKNVDFSSLAQNIFTKLKKEQKKFVIDEIVAIKLEDDFLERVFCSEEAFVCDLENQFLSNKQRQIINWETLVTMLKGLKICPVLGNVNHIIQNHPDSICKFISVILSSNYPEKARKLQGLSLLNKELRGLLAKACLITPFKKDANYSGVKEIYRNLTSQERNAILNTLANQVHNNFNYSRNAFVDSKALKVLIDEYGEKFITDANVAKNVLTNFSVCDFCLLGLKWSEVAKLFDSYSKDQDFLIKQIYSNACGRSVSFKNGNFNEFSLESKEDIWGKLCYNIIKADCVHGHDFVNRKQNFSTSILNNEVFDLQFDEL